MTAMTWNCFGVVLGLKKDGTCVLGKDAFAGNASYYYLFNSTRMGNDLFSYLLAEVHSWHDIRQIMANDRFFAALDGSGRIIYLQDGFAGLTDNWPLMRQIALGKRSSAYDDLYLAGLS